MSCAKDDLFSFQLTRPQRIKRPFDERRTTINQIFVQDTQLASGPIPRDGERVAAVGLVLLGAEGAPGDGAATPATEGY